MYSKNLNPNLVVLEEPESVNFTFSFHPTFTTNYLNQRRIQEAWGVKPPPPPSLGCENYDFDLSPPPPGMSKKISIPGKFPVYAADFNFKLLVTNDDFFPKDDILIQLWDLVRRIR